MSRKAKIVIVPMGEVDFMLVNRLATNIGPIFGKSVDIIKGMRMPEESYNVIRNQYYASIIFQRLERIKAMPREFIVGICEEDIYLPDEAFVIGHADALMGAAAISLYRIRQEFYGLPEDDMKIYSRLFKQAVHHVSHLVGINGCRNPKCANFYSQVMFDIDNKSEKLCDICRRQLIGVTT